MFDVAQKSSTFLLEIMTLWELINNRWCRLVSVSTGVFTACNSGVMGSFVYMIMGFSWRSWFLNSVYKPHPNFGGSKKCGLYMRKYGKAVIYPQPSILNPNPYSSLMIRVFLFILKATTFRIPLKMSLLS
jgi:hypothetical protein